MAELVTVSTYRDAGEAYLARGFLEQEGLEAFVFDENMGSLYPSGTVGWVKLKVRAADLERARALLDDIEKEAES